MHDASCTYGVKAGISLQFHMEVCRSNEPLKQDIDMPSG